MKEQPERFISRQGNCIILSKIKMEQLNGSHDKEKVQGVMTKFKMKCMRGIYMMENVTNSHASHFSLL